MVVDRKKGWDDYSLFRKGRIFISATVLYHVQYRLACVPFNISHRLL